MVGTMPLFECGLIAVAFVLWSAAAVQRVPKKINYGQKEQEILDHILGGSYDSKILPSGVNGTGPTEVTVNLYLRSIEKIDDYNMEYSVQLTFRALWLDDRLKFDALNVYRLQWVKPTGIVINSLSWTIIYVSVVTAVRLIAVNKSGIPKKNLTMRMRPPILIYMYGVLLSSTLPNAFIFNMWITKELTPGKLRYLTLTDSSRIWMPDLFFSNEKQGHLHHLLVPNVYFRIFPGGQVLYSNRISLTLSCPMTLVLYPLDKQSCSIRIASFAFTTADVFIKWKQADPVQVSSSLHLPRFALEQFTTDYCDSQTNTGTYSCVRVDFLFKREFSYFFTQFYIPCFILVLASWISFWLNENAAPERASLGVTVLLAMVTQISGINENLSPVSYIKALDLWTLACLAFVFGALLEFALINYYYRQDQQRAIRTGQVKLEHSGDLEADGGVAVDNPDDESTSLTTRYPNEAPALTSGSNVGVPVEIEPKRKGTARCWLSNYPSRSKRIDVVSRVIFPLSFTFFNIAYWHSYLPRQD